MHSIVIIGRGKLADSILDNLMSFDIEGLIDSVKAYEGGMQYGHRSIFVHVGSGRQYQETLRKAVECGCVYIQASTMKDTPMEPPKEGSIPFINAPNLDLNIIRFLSWLKQAGTLFDGEQIEITESHQSEKTTIPGTAYKMAEILGADPAAIISVRDPHRQFELGISNIGRHAWHRIVIGEGDSQLRFQTKIEGLLPYVRGLYRILSICGKLDKKNYDIEDLVEKGFI